MGGLVTNNTTRMEVQSDLAYSLVEDKKKLRKTGHNINFETHQNFTRVDCFLWIVLAIQKKHIYL